ncbi:MAG: hypothetical protein JRH20_15260 [Deltaproteobacteria bacterium]|nr:hypothetical protein [Deltaproteobacteria bacterium]
MTILTRSVRVLLTPTLFVALLGAGCVSSTPVTPDDQGASDHDVGVADVSTDMHATPDRGTTLPDGPMLDSALTTADLLLADAGMGFPQVLEGVWLVGWVGGLNRFSWVRFTLTSATGGSAEILAGTFSLGTVPYWGCSGVGSWNVTSEAQTIQLHYPSSECTGMRSEDFTFISIASVTEDYPRGAQLAATIEADSSSPSTISGYKFPLSQCAPDMSGCMDPL